MEYKSKELSHSELSFCLQNRVDLATHRICTRFWMPRKQTNKYRRLFIAKLALTLYLFGCLKYCSQLLVLFLQGFLLPNASTSLRESPTGWQALEFQDMYFDWKRQTSTDSTASSCGKHSWEWEICDAWDLGWRSEKCWLMMVGDLLRFPKFPDLSGFSRCLSRCFAESCFIRSCKFRAGRSSTSGGP